MAAVRFGFRVAGQEGDLALDITRALVHLSRIPAAAWPGLWSDSWLHKFWLYRFDQPTVAFWICVTLVSALGVVVPAWNIVRFHDWERGVAYFFSTSLLLGLLLLGDLPRYADRTYGLAVGFAVLGFALCPRRKPGGPPLRVGHYGVVALYGLLVLAAVAGARELPAEPHWDAIRAQFRFIAPAGGAMLLAASWTYGTWKRRGGAWPAWVLWSALLALVLLMPLIPGLLFNRLGRMFGPAITTLDCGIPSRGTRSPVPVVLPSPR